MFTIPVTLLLSGLCDVRGLCPINQTGIHGHRLRLSGVLYYSALDIFVDYHTCASKCKVPVLIFLT